MQFGEASSNIPLILLKPGSGVQLEEEGSATHGRHFFHIETTLAAFQPF